MDLIVGFGGAAISLVVFIMVLFAVVKSFLYIGRPNEVLIFSGRDNALPGGEVVGYRYQIGGRTMKVPILETVEQMDLRVIPVNIRIQGAYSKGGIPLNVHAIANIKISSEPDKIHNAIERFLGVERSEIMRVAQETLEGNLRGVLATLTPEDVNENRLRFVEELQKDVEPDFEKLGLHLDVLKIQNVSDDRDYLDSIGRKRIAEIVKQAEIAESNAMKEAEEIEAHEQGRSEVARRRAQAQIQKSQNELREMMADFELKAKSEEEKSEARALATRAESEQELQKVRTDLEAIRLQADVVIPAEADKVARELLAAGEAAEIAEKGRAMAEVLRMMTEVWAEAGEAAMDIFLIQRMEQIMGQVAQAARQVQVREVALIDSGDGSALPNYVSSFPRIVGSVFTDLRDIVGVDVGKVLRGDDLEFAERLMAEVEQRTAIEGSSSPKAAKTTRALESNSTTQQVNALRSEDAKPSFSALKQRISNKPGDGSEG